MIKYFKYFLLINLNTFFGTKEIFYNLSEIINVTPFHMQTILLVSSIVMNIYTLYLKLQDKTNIQIS